MSNSKNDSTYVPLLSEKHSGIPEWLLEKAQHAKLHASSVTTKTLSPSQRTPVYPQGVEQRVFDEAINELRRELGADHVILNDQPLKDGW
jgi:hypothetical protein